MARFDAGVMRLFALICMHCMLPIKLSTSSFEDIRKLQDLFRLFCCRAWQSGDFDPGLGPNNVAGSVEAH